MQIFKPFIQEINGYLEESAISFINELTQLAETKDANKIGKDIIIWIEIVVSNAGQVLAQDENRRST